MNMAGLQIHTVEDAGTVILKLEGRFDARTAVQLSKSLAEIPDKPVVLDFSRVREFLDVAVAVLSRGMYERNVRLQGLVGHQERMFRYFGFPTLDSPRRDYYTPEPALLVN
ncbi:MAG TPA: STAS domain-containing protein [Longimicrobium sp.]|nr:STAS domain-containing protein [Longimicrobium sp.]